MSARGRWWLVLAIAAMTWLVRLDEPPWGDGVPRYLFDEHYTAFAAHRVLEGDSSVFTPAARRYEVAAFDTSDLAPSSRGEWSHPPGAADAVAVSMAVFGFNAFAARLPSVLAAAIVLVATGALAGRKNAAWACALLACDGVFFVFARTAMPHMMLAAGVSAGAACTLRATRARASPLRAAIGAGVAFGFAASVRWTAAPIAVAILVAGMFTSTRRGRLRRLVLPAALAAIAMYSTAFVPYFAHGGTLTRLVRLHIDMLWFHDHLPAHMALSSPWYEWPWTRRPIPFGWRAVGDRRANVWAVGNPVLWWGTVPVLAAAAWRARHRSPEYAVGLAGALGVWLPWSVIGRFALHYYLLPAMPFVAALAARMLDRARLRRTRRWIAGAALVIFALLYPVLAAVPMEQRTEHAYRAIMGLH